MELDMVFDRFENGYAILLLNEMGLVIEIPANQMKQSISKGQVVHLSIDCIRGV